MINILEKLGGATRVAFLVLVVNLNALMWYSLVYYPDTRFLTIFALFSNITTGIVTYFTTKSMYESKVGAAEKRNEPDEVIDLTSK